MHGQKTPVKQMEGSAHEHSPCCHDPPRIDCGLGVYVLRGNWEGSVNGGTMAILVLGRLGVLGVVGVKGLVSGAMTPAGSLAGIGGCF